MSVYTHAPRSDQMAEPAGTSVVGSVPTTFIAELFAPMAKALLTAHVEVELAQADADTLKAEPTEGGRAVLYWPGVFPSKCGGFTNCGSASKKPEFGKAQKSVPWPFPGGVDLASKKQGPPADRFVKKFAFVLPLRSSYGGFVGCQDTLMLLMK